MNDPLNLYHQMLTIRRTEEQLVKSHQRGLIHGACHTYIGQEAIAVGVCAHLDHNDVVFSTHRGHGHALAKGVTPEQLMAELYGRESGVSHGRGGSMHLFSPEVGMMGTSGIVGPCILQAAGAGYSFMLLKNQRVAVAFFGDGAVNNGAFHEGLNLASIWKLPALFVCENNQFATEVPFQEVAGNPSVAARGAVYGMPGIEVDGNDVLGIQKIAGDAVKRARAGEGPTLLECKTYRTRPHSEGMGDFTYRTREEVEAWKARCPIQRLRTWIIEQRIATDADLDKIDAEITAAVSAGHERAEKSAWPDPATAASHVFHEPRPSGSGGSRSLTVAARSSREINYMQATLEALTHEMAHNPGIFVLGEGIGKRGGNFKTTAGLYDIHGPERLRDTPISERGFVGLGCGAAMTGTRPVIDFMFADFVMDSVGEIVNQIAKMQYMSNGRLTMPILLRGCIGIGHSAATHHSGNYYPMYGNFPGLRVAVPSTPYDAKGLLHHALRCDDPVLFLEHRDCLTVKGNVPAEPYEIPFGQAAVVREGTDLTVVALCYMVHQTLKACQQLGNEVSIELIDPRTVAPLDIDTIAKSVAKTGRLLIVDEAFAPYGIGAEIAAQLADRGFDDLDAPIRRLNGLHTPTPYSPTLEAAVVPNVEQIVQAIRDLVSEKGSCNVAIPIIIPRLGWNMEEGIFLGWLKADGDSVRAGETLFRLESEKAAEDIECHDAGILRIVPKGPKDGDTLPVGCVIGYLVQAGEELQIADFKLQIEEKTAAKVGEPSPVRGRLERTGIASPRAKRIAKELGVDWTSLAGSGRNGRIREKDVRAALAQPAGKTVPLSSVRKAGVARLVKSVQTTVPVTLTTIADVTELVKLREQVKVGLNDVFVKATALALQQHPLLAARWADDHLVFPDTIHIGIAVDTDAGLQVPVVHDAATLTLLEIATRSRDLIERARAGKLTSKDVQGGVFTITNLGIFGIDAFTPIINWPECAILGIGCIRRTPVFVDDKVVPRDQVTLSLTFDHRIVDGAPAARFLSAISHQLSAVSEWLADS